MPHPWKRATALTLLSASVACNARISDASDAVFPAEVLPVYRLDFEDRDWEEALDAAFDPKACDGHAWVEASLTYENPVTGEDEVYERVGVRRRGHNIYQKDGTRADGVERPGFKIGIDTFLEDAEFHGLTKVNLLGTEGDPTLLRERLATELMREADVRAPVVTHAVLYVNGDFLGVFPNSQEADDQAFLDATFPEDADGSYYKVKGYCGSRSGLNDLGDDPVTYASIYEPRAGTRPEDMTTDLIPFLKCASEPDDAAFQACIPNWIDVDAWLAEISMDMVLPDVDGMASAGQNFLLYHRPSDGRFVVVPWDKDQSFKPELIREGTGGLFSMEPAWLEGSTPALVDRLRTTFRAAYCEEAIEAVGLYDPDELLPRIDALEDMMKTRIRQDPYMDPSIWATDLDALRDVVTKRHAAILDEARTCGR